MLRRLGIRAKVLAVLAVPMIVLLLAGTYISLGAIQDLRYAQATQNVVRTLDVMSPVSAALQQERILSLTGASAEQIAAARQATDQALSAAREVTQDIDLSQFPASVVRDFQDQQKTYSSGLQQVRDRVDNQTQRAILRNGFQDIVDGQDHVVEGVANSLRDRDLATYIRANREVALLVDALVNEYITGVELKTAPIDSPVAARTFADQVTATELARERARTAVGDLRLDGVAISTGDPNAAVRSMRALLTQGTLAAFGSVDLEQWSQETTTQFTALASINQSIIDKATDTAAAAASSARDTAVVTVGIAIAALAASFLLAITVARSIVVPLRRLTGAAADVREQLPRLVEQVSTPGEGPEITLAPIPVRSNDEVGRLAQAFNAVNATTVQVAQEQAALRGSIAEMFVNVARRDQVLLNRQLSFIDSLERAEEDPGTLANLFRLDHLATRMRRNAESLLVLAGIDSGRRLRDAMPLSDVIRTASSEIEQYDRVELDLQVDPHMLGFNALSAAHLIAELLENATVFSEPETPVVVTTGITGGSVIVRITDQGLGMTDAEIEAANTKIVSVSAGDALGAQRLGLFVVGRLAQRLGAEVTLRKRVGGTGTEAFVRFPNTLFSANEVNAYGAPPAAQVAAPAAQQIEAPAVREVDLAQLTDGQTDLGLPRRRRGDEAGAAPLPTAPAAARAPITEAGAPAAGLVGTPGELPTRSRKTFDEDNIVLPVAPETTLSPELSVDTGEWSPAVLAAPRATGLPTRSRSAAPAPVAEPEPDAGRQAALADPAARAGLFSGFRGREAAVPAPDPAPAPEAPTSEAAPAVEVPALEPDPAPAPQADAWSAPTWQGEASSLPSRGGASDLAQRQPQDDTTPAWQAPQDEQPWAPVQAESQPLEAARADEQAWSSPAAPSWEAPQDEQPWAPVQAESQPLEASRADEQAWSMADAPSWEAPQDEPTAHDAPSTQQEQPAWAPSWDAGATERHPEAEPDRATPDAAAVEAQPETEPETETEAEPAFTAYSGYSGWAGGGAERPAVEYTEPYAPFGRSLDEARAWHTGAIPVVPEPAAEEAPGWSAPAAEQQPAWASAEDAHPDWGLPSTQQSAEPQPDWAAAEPQPDWAAAEQQQPDWAAAEQQQPVWPVAEPAAEQQPVWAAAEPQPAWSAEPQPAVPTFELEPDVEEEVAAPWAPVAATPPTTVAPVPAPPVDPEPAPQPVAEAWRTPSWQQASPAGDAAPAAPSAVDPARPAAPLWARPVAAEQPTQMFSPVESADAVAPFDPPAAPAPQAPVAAAPAPAPAWPAAPAAPASPAAQPAFSDLVAPEEDKPRRRWGNFFSRKRDEPAPAPQQPAAPTPEVTRTPVRSSAWSPDSAPAAPAQPAPEATGWQAPSWSAPAAPPQAAPAPAPAAAATPPEARTAPSWSPPEWAARQPAAPTATVPHPSVPPSTAPRVGTLDDEVAAMLALRSDIQEQALSELSQLSAYRPSAVGAGGSERLIKRVPSAVPAAPAPMEERPVQRDADQLRSRLSSFQSGTSRGRRASTGPENGDHQ
ncbi:sensor histidine kinase [Cellulomonas iranensis]|uniref:histidine kinase n=2 Tax=Cellulomonas iranensis TaxID=76862 RepID=A0ABU0GJZ2_9CELL|nr:ATP-binding protein [Cellulomonas iranensis]MDQ0425686.1 signal transduction histidine kinase/CHASE3 domain sensor protein [Cellulomonas iranensis]